MRGDIILKSDIVTAQAAETESYAMQIKLLLQLHAPTNAGGAQHRAREESPFRNDTFQHGKEGKCDRSIILATF